MKRKPWGSDFWSCVKGSDEDTCWEWRFGTMNSGYGKVWYKGKVCATHRVAYELAFGTISNGLHVLHLCDNKLCCNPKHLRLGTDKDNMLDKVQKGRCTWGESNGGSKLTNAQREEIRKLYSSGKYSQTALGSKYGVSQSRVHRIINKPSTSELLARGANFPFPIEADAAKVWDYRTGEQIGRVEDA